jgi:tetratricopeptide (TPR) repeat protein
MAQEKRDLHREAALLNNRGLLQKSGGQLAEAAVSFQAALSLNEQLDDPGAQAANLVNLGLVAEEAGRLEEARIRLEAALARDKAAENRGGIAADLAHLARLAERQDQKAAAFTYAQRAYWTYRSLGEMDRALKALTHALSLSRYAPEHATLELQTELKTFQDPRKPLP